MEKNKNMRNNLDKCKKCKKCKLFSKVFYFFALHADKYMRIKKAKKF